MRKRGGNYTDERRGARLKAAVLMLAYVLTLLSPVVDARQVHAATGDRVAATSSPLAPELHDAAAGDTDDPACAWCALLGAALRYGVVPVPTTAWPPAPVALPWQQGVSPHTSAPLLAPGSRAPPLA